MQEQDQALSDQGGNPLLLRSQVSSQKRVLALKNERNQALLDKVKELPALCESMRADSAAAKKTLADRSATFKTKFAEKNAELQGMQRQLDQMQREKARSSAATEKKFLAQIHALQRRIAELQK